MVMKRVETLTQGNSNSSLEVVTFLWINVSAAYNFNIMNTLYEFGAKSTQWWKIFAVSFK